MRVVRYLFRKRFILSVLCVFMVHQDPAYASYELPVTYRIMFAEQNWQEVKQTNVDKTLPFCTVRKMYDAGHAIYLSGSVDSFSLLFEIPNTNFKNGDLHNVLLQTDDYILYEQSLKNLKGHVLKIPLGGYDRIGKGLENAQTLYLALNKSGYKFSIDDVEAGMDLLKVCLENKNIFINAPSPASLPEPDVATVSEDYIDTFDGALDPSAPDTFSTSEKTPNLPSPVLTAAPRESFPEQERYSAEAEGGELYADGFRLATSGQTPTGLNEDDRELFESMKSKMFLLEREKEAARTKLMDIRQKEIAAMKVDIGSLHKIEEQAQKIKVLQQKLQQYEYGQVQQPSQDFSPLMEPPSPELTPPEDSLSAEQDGKIGDVIHNLTSDENG